MVYLASWILIILFGVNSHGSVVSTEPQHTRGTNVLRTRKLLNDRKNLVLIAQTHKPEAFSFEWYQGEKRIDTHRSKYQIKGNSSYSSLTIPPSEQNELTLMYEVVAKPVDSSNDSAVMRSTYIVKLGDLVASFNTSRKNEIIRMSVTRNEGEPLNLTCLLNIDDELSSPPKITWLFRPEREKNFSEWKEDNVVTSVEEGDTLVFDKLEKSNRGWFQCQYHNSSRDVFIRVKDKYAVLWPFIGIIIEVILLVAIILFCERKQRKNKQASANAEENTQQSESLIKSKMYSDTGNAIKKRSSNVKQ